MTVTVDDLTVQAARVRTKLANVEALIDATSPLAGPMADLHAALLKSANMGETYCNVSVGTFAGGGKPP